MSDAPDTGAPRTCAGCGNTPGSPRHAHTMFASLDNLESELVEQALEADLWLCPHCPATIGGDERSVGGDGG